MFDKDYPHELTGISDKEKEQKFRSSSKAFVTFFMN
jgi:hypothetical protein